LLRWNPNSHLSFFWDVNLGTLQIEAASRVVGRTCIHFTVLVVAPWGRRVALYVEVDECLVFDHPLALVCLNISPLAALGALHDFL